VFHYNDPSIMQYNSNINSYLGLSDSHLSTLKPRLPPQDTADTSKVNLRKVYDDELLGTNLSSEGQSHQQKNIQIEFDYDENSILEDKSECSYTE
jgi:hypothetical protein